MMCSSALAVLAICFYLQQESHNSTTSLQEDPSPQLYLGRSEDWSTTDEEKPQLSSRSPSHYTMGIRRQSTQGRDEPIHNLLEDQNILGSSRRPAPLKEIRRSTTIIASSQHIKSSKAPTGQSTLKIQSQSDNTCLFLLTNHIVLPLKCTCNMC
jgi:hypothetical protein